jgi:hypothetical protein
MIFKKGDWQEARLVFDEDDDCNRWERVEFYDPLDLFKTGGGKGGLDNNPQADVIGDRGEFDMDNSGKGNLYIAAFDGRIHLHGAEWGAWRIDQNAFSFQGFGGLYDRWKPNRLQKNIDSFASVKYTDSDNNGFIDVIEYDLDGDQKFEDKVSLKALDIDDKQTIINTAELNYKKIQKLYKKVANDIWANALAAMEVAKKHKLNTDWYAFYKKPNSLNEKYQYGYWLSFYIYQDLRHQAKSLNKITLINQLDKAYYSGNWVSLKN